MGAVLDVFKNKINSLFNNKISCSSVIFGSKIESTSSIRPDVRLYHSIVGRYTYVGRNTLVQNTKIGAFCSISENCNIGMPSHPINFVSTSPVFLKGKNYLRINFEEFEYEDCPPTYIGNDVWIGANVQIKSGLTIEDGAIIAAGAVVTKNVPAFSIVAGVPAKVIRFRFDEVTCEAIKKSAWWSYSDTQLKSLSKYFDSTEKFLMAIQRLRE